MRNSNGLAALGLTALGAALVLAAGCGDDDDAALLPPARANRAPVAQDVAETCDAGAFVAVTLSGFDGDGDKLTYTIVSQPLYGILSGTDAEPVYTPAATSSYTDSFTYRASDGKDYSDFATVTIAVLDIGGNHSPVAQSSSLTTPVNTALPVTLQALDAVVADTLTYEIMNEPRAPRPTSSTPPPPATSAPMRSRFESSTPPSTAIPPRWR